MFPISSNATLCMFDISVPMLDLIDCRSLQVCMTCIRCKSCGVTPGKSWDTDWNHDKGLCPDCSKLNELGEERLDE